MPINFQQSGSDIDSRFIRKEFFQVGNLWTWGSNASGQLGTNNTTNFSSPVQTVAGGLNWRQISACNSSTTGIKDDGTLWLWGYNYYGQLGDNTKIDKSSPVQTVAGGNNWKQVSAGRGHIASIKTDGTLWSSGYNYFGTTGNNINGNKYSSPVQTVAGGSNWKQVSTGSYHTACIKSDGTLWTWGYNVNGQLGTNDITNRSSPVQTVAGDTNWQQISANETHTAGIKTDGTLWLWGANSFGQLGDNTIVKKSSPIQTTAGGNNWKQISAGYSSAAIKTDGTLWVWGRNNYGQLGTNNTTDRSSPVQTVAGGTNWKQVSSTSPRMGAIKTDGTLWMWGLNTYGQLGTNNTTDRSSPVQTVAGGTNWKQVSCAYHMTIAITNVI